MFSQKCIPTQKFAVLGAHRNTIPAVWYDRCVTKCAVVKGLNIGAIRSLAARFRGLLADVTSRIFAPREDNNFFYRKHRSYSRMLVIRFDGEK